MRVHHYIKNFLVFAALVCSGRLFNFEKMAAGILAFVAFCMVSSVVYIINDICDKEKDRKRTDKSFFVDKKEIVDNDYDLSINRYKEIKYVPVKYPPTKDILAEIMKLDEEASKDLQELKNMLEK